ncbi:glutathione S-transferase family protein [Dokdonella sp. MW10]|uniref:glutathione S-transferase family protein n=1 Tax=Dokdonella sp. MW10 TaxID=2992926 RepID=UPI003F7EF998
MKLYYLPGACSLADHIVLEWIGEPYEAVAVPRDELKTAFLAINPAGAVPVLEHDGWRLTQNIAILNFLADLHPALGLAGDGTPASRAEVNRWLAFVNSDLHPAFKPIFGSTAYLEDRHVIDRTREHARETLRTLFGRVDTQLEGRTWLTGARSIADAYLYVVTRWARGKQVDLSGYANLDRHFAAMDADPGVRKAVTAEGLN